MALLLCSCPQRGGLLQTIASSGVGALINGHQEVLRLWEVARSVAEEDDDMAMADLDRPTSQSRKMPEKSKDGGPIRRYAVA